MASARSSPPSTTLRRPLSSSTMLFSACINVRMTITQLAAVGNSASNANPIDLALCKIYAASVPSDLPTDKLLTHFFVYGKIKEGSLGLINKQENARVFTAPKCSPIAHFSHQNLVPTRASFMLVPHCVASFAGEKQAISSLNNFFVDAYKSGIHEGSIAEVSPNMSALAVGSTATYKMLHVDQYYASTFGNILTIFIAQKIMNLI
ncbi:hypothetical protein JHK82_042435 [Glycine max]|nr:hypothetical protein JHK86_042473 [Glycine max]KAG4956722.1 hypothetical protein JHK85_043102 [Glycine max]KAG5105465.1 hypothetical protein JHK82_042435 [Glycine max]KAG5116587.1 hypothetical protein JHK84_042700 [Glycine max]